MIHVVATITVLPGRRAEFLAAFHELVPQVHAEVGCLEYGPAIDLATSIPGLPAIREEVVTVIEKWESVSALADHLAAPHMQQYREKVKEMVTSVDVRVLQPA